MLVLWLLKHWEAKIIDIETDFLEGDLDEEIYMRVPEGYYEVFEENEEEEALELLNQSMG